MRRRICVVGVALSVGPLALLAGAVGATAKSLKGKKPKATAVSCRASISVAVAPGASAVLPPVDQGSEYGPLRCGDKLFGGGLQHDSFTVATSGDTLARYSLYFRAGTVYGTYDLTPQEGSLDFLSTSWAGVLKVTGGTGVYRGVKGTGTMTCSTTDGIHTTCSDRLALMGLTKA